MKAEENIRQVINKILHSHIDVNKHEDYTNYKKLITDIENLILQQREEADRDFEKEIEPYEKWVNNRLNQIVPRPIKITARTCASMIAEYQREHFQQRDKAEEDLFDWLAQKGYVPHDSNKKMLFKLFQDYKSKKDESR